MVLALVSHLMVATIQGSTMVPLGNHKLKDGLIGRPELGLAIQEAILEEQLLLYFGIGGRGLFIKHLQEGFLEGFV